MELNRGDIVIVNLYPKKGDEVGKIRPAVIISGNDESARESRLYLLNHIFSRSLRALHPFMPFITEEIWQEYDGTGLIMIENWG